MGAIFRDSVLSTPLLRGKLNCILDFDSHKLIIIVVVVVVGVLERQIIQASTYKQNIFFSLRSLGYPTYLESYMVPFTKESPTNTAATPPKTRSAKEIPQLDPMKRCCRLSLTQIRICHLLWPNQIHDPRVQKC